MAKNLSGYVSSFVEAMKSQLKSDQDNWGREYVDNQASLETGIAGVW